MKKSFTIRPGPYKAEARGVDYLFKLKQTKNVQRLILELGDKIGSPKNLSNSSWRESLITALVGLGWNRKDAATAAEQVETPENEADLSDSLRSALKILSKNR